MNEEDLNEDEEQESQALIPTVQDTITFNGNPLVVVRLPDGRPGVVLRWICQNLHLASRAQIERIKRTEVIADDLVYVQVQTEGGSQNMATLVLHGIAYWLATIDTRRMDKDDPRRVEIWHEYHLRMAAVIEWQMEVETWRGGVENRLEGLEAIIPDILDRLPPPTLTPEHQQQVQAFVHQLHEASGKPYGTIYNDLKTAFAVAKYDQIPEGEWNKVAHWFQVQIQRAKKR